MQNLYLDWYDYGARQYDAGLGRFVTVDPAADKYWRWSPYAYCLDNPVKYIDFNGETPRVYIETNSFGHTFVTTGEGKNTIVYTYGRYGEVKWNKSNSGSLSLSGEGVLIILKGKEAIDYIREEIYDQKAKVYEISNADDAKVDGFFQDLFDSSELKPTKGKYMNSDHAKVINEYDLFDNNCTTISIKALDVGTDGHFNHETTSPVGLDTKLYYESKKENSQVERIYFENIYNEYFK